MLDKHLILIGFKHVGKSTIGRLLSQSLAIDFIDLDEMIEDDYFDLESKRITCRQIMKLHGEEFFRKFETKTLIKALDNKPSVIALGGGTAAIHANQQLIQDNIIFHITANPDVVYERIIAGGIPAFFMDVMQPRDAFDALWLERDVEYSKISHYRVDNTFEVENAVNNILSRIML